MKQFTFREFIRIAEQNGFYFDRQRGDHCIYVNKEGKHMSIPQQHTVNLIINRLIKENHLITDKKKLKELRKKERNNAL